MAHKTTHRDLVTNVILLYLMGSTDLLSESSGNLVIPFSQIFNSLRPRQNGRRFPDDIFKWIFLNENVWISITISLKFVSRGLIKNNLWLVQIMTWCRSGGKPSSEPMMVSLLTRICVTRPQWVNEIQSINQTNSNDHMFFILPALLD